MNRNLKYLITASIVYVILFIFKKTEIYFPILSDYLADLICIPIVLGWIKLIMDKLSVQNFRWGKLAILIAVIYFSIVFELIMPSFSSNYTRDFIDVILYGIGGIIFYFSLQKSSTISQHLRAY